MLGKLIKHEFKATYRSYLLLFGSLIFLTLLTKIILKVNPEYTFYYLISRLFLVVDILMMAVVSFVGRYMVVTRFNRHLLKDEGYLAHTLPVKTWQHIFTKGLVGTIWLLLCDVMMAVSIFLYVGNFSKIMRFLSKNMGQLIRESKHLVFTMILIIIAVILTVAAQVNSYMAALSFGQLFSKHKILGAVFFWFAVNYAIGIVAGAFERSVIEWIGEAGPKVFGRYGEVNLFLIIIIITEVLIGLVYFFVADYILSKKLNLE